MRSAIGAFVLSAATTIATAGGHFQTATSHRILFVGNSLTAANGLTKMVEALARAGGDEVEIMTVAVNNFSLEDHWNSGEVRTAIARGNWTFVVLQQGPSALPESQALLRDYAKRFSSEAQKAGSRIALYMTWPPKTREADFDAVSESYRLAARHVDGVLLPGGDAWRAAWRLDPSLQLYAEDGFHPSRLGSYVAALTIWRGLSGRTVIGLPGIDGVNPETIQLVQKAAEQQFVSAPRRQEFAALR